MAGPPPLPEDARDASHLQVLSTLHYVYAGLGLVALLFVAGHYFVMRAASEVIGPTIERAHEEVKRQQESNPDMLPRESVPEIPPDLFETIFDSLRWLYLVVAFWVVLKMVLNFIAARFLAGRRNRTFLIVVAALNCLSIPLGTALGIFTLVVLARPSMRVTFGEPGSPALT